MRRLGKAKVVPFGNRFLYLIGGKKGRKNMGQLIISTANNNESIDTQMEGMSIKDALFATCAFTIATAKEIGMSEEQLNEAMSGLWNDEELEHVSQ